SFNFTEKESILCFFDPSSNILTIEVKENIAETLLVRIYDFSGQKHLEQKYNNLNRIELDVNEIPVGTYMARLFVNNKSYDLKFIKK
ncbi:MAG: T9SS type A sorting domain-containing protein, partial [Bacteroidales bacterium]|nr:T9SS type A sorting domain-containing protein [Bacteroidales bacterium]